MKKFYADLIPIAAPIALQGIISSSLGLVDSIMVGGLGEGALASVGIAMQLFFVHYLIVFGFTSGCSTFLTQFSGAGDSLNVRKTLGFATTIAMAIGVVFFVAGVFFPETIISLYSTDKAVLPLAKTYMSTGAVTVLFLGISIPCEAALKGTRQTKLPLYISTATFTINTSLNYVLIYGKLGMPAMGVKGVAIATVIARFLELILVLIVVLGSNNRLAGKFSDYFGWSKEFFVRVFKNARTTTANELLWSLGQTLYVAAFARLGVTSYAAFQAANNICGLFFFAAFSLGDAALIMVGQHLGKGEMDKTQTISMRLLSVGAGMGVFCGLLMYVASGPIIGLYSLSSLGEVYAKETLLVMAVFMVINTYNTILVVGILRAGGDTLFAMLAECGCVWLVGVPMAFIGALVFHLPIYWVVLMTRSADFLKGILLTVRFFSQRWNKRVISGLES